jgi:two-component system sensor histidine kinase RpfC
MEPRTLARIWGSAAAIAALSAAHAGAAGVALGIASTGGAALVAVWLAARLHRRELVAFRQRQDAALAHTVHELRTPLASISMALEMVREGYLAEPEELANCLDQASLAARHLGFLVDDVLDSAAASAGQLRLQLRHHRVTDLFDEAKELLGVQAETRGLQLRFLAPDPALQVHTDNRRFLQILLNLTGNALKFSAPGDCITIDAVRLGAMVRFAVHDHGPGVPQQLRDRLFQPYGTTDALGGNGPSTGLGLHVSTVLARQLGGTIGYQPGPTRGSVFWFELPVAVADTPGAAGPAARDAAAALHPAATVR